MATTLLLTEYSAAKGAKVFLQGWLGKAHRTGDWAGIVFPENKTEMDLNLRRNAAWQLGQVAASNLRASGIPQDAWEFRLQLIMAPILSKASELGNWEAAWGRPMWTLEEDLTREMFPIGLEGDALYDRLVTLPSAPQNTSDLTSDAIAPITSVGPRGFDKGDSFDVRLWLLPREREG